MAATGSGRWTEPTRILPIDSGTTCPDRFDPCNSDATVSERLKSKIVQLRSHSTEEIINILCDTETDLA